MDSMCEHGPGHSEVLYDGPSNRVVSVGADSAMVLRDAATGEEVNLCVDEHDYTPIRALALSPAAADYTPQLITGCESGTIRVFSFPELQFKSNLARFDAPVRQLRLAEHQDLLLRLVVHETERILRPQRSIRTERE